MINIIILSIIISHIFNKILYKICDEIEKTTLNTIIVYLAITLPNILIYYKYGITSESINYIGLIPFIIIISIIDYHTTYIYDITILGGIIIQVVIFILTMNNELNYFSHISSYLIGFILPYIICKTTKALGSGDIGLFALCCFTLGHNYSLYLIMMSFVLACIYVVYVVLIKCDKIIKIPFAPFISLGTILIMITNYDILNLILT